MLQELTSPLLISVQRITVTFQFLILKEVNTVIGHLYFAILRQCLIFIQAVVVRIP